MITQCSGGEHCVSPVQPAIFKVQADVFVRCLIGPFIQNRSRSRLLAPDRSQFCNWLFIDYSFVTHWLGCHNSLTSRISGCKGQQGGKNWCRGFTECVYYFNTYAFCNIIWKGFLLELGFKLHAERLIPSEVIEYFCLWKFFSGTYKFIFWK